MKITLNGEAVELRGATLADALAEHGYADAQVATAVNEEFVPKAQRPMRKLADGDRVEVVAPRQGG
jgi:sulfur carrier protein